MYYLVDSSGWIEFFNGNTNFAFIKELLTNNSVCTNDIVLTELLPSMKQKKELTLIELISGIYKYEITINWKELQESQLKNLLHGNNNVPVTDLIILQNCLQNNLKIIARDKHFHLMSAYLPLEIYTPHGHL
jgi:predicted nucleic acid-binding protein